MKLRRYEHGRYVNHEAEIAIRQAIREANWDALNRMNYFRVYVFPDGTVTVSEFTDCNSYYEDGIVVFSAYYGPEKTVNPSMEQHALVEDWLNYYTEEAMKTLNGARI